ncbi:hypothetical protein B0H15DRAFT_543602 [Mycena belliarum]|uniref:Uncharacterized protein n=1 Tax=Mycena belliarum TaxID=1033014 RepID=A0AAD6UG41_9AGAR|nr:hypothetical protein B0H15DRAFT_543602 [Mycena belliae]
MSNGSASAYLLWALLSVSFFSFMLGHLWSYDKFKCLRWDSGRQPGAFKRVMTYSYFATVPLLMVFAVAMTALKYQEGSILWKDGTVMPRPFALWQKTHLRWIIPLYFVLSFAWALELVTHLEELTFWLFLLHQGPKKREWFHSWEFRVWRSGSLIAILGMPLTTLMKRHNVETCEAWIFLAGASAGTFTTICFLYVLGKFPGFIRSVKAEGAEPDVVVRLSTFYQLNCIRVIFRFLFTVPLLVMALDGLLDKSLAVIKSPFWSDILLMTGGMGCFISSAITMLVFFPRSMTIEAGYKAQARSHSPKPQTAASAELPDYERHEYARHEYPRLDSPLPSRKSMTSLDRVSRPDMHVFNMSDEQSELDVDPDALHGKPPPQHDELRYETRSSLRPTSGTRSDDTMWDGARMPAASTSQPPERNEHFAGPLFVNGTPIYVEEVPPSPPYPLIHPYAMNFTSPIDLLEEER